MTLTDLRTAAAIPAGWYPDPVDAAALRWWSGENWTEHTSAPAVPEPPFVVESAVVESAVTEPAVSEPEALLHGYTWASDEPIETARPADPSPSVATTVRRKNTRRDQSMLSGAALAMAVIGLFGFVAGQLLELSDVVLYAVGGATFAFAAVAVIVAVRTRRGLAVAGIAAVLCLANVGMVAALGAVTAHEDVSTPLENSASFENLLETAVVDAVNGMSVPGIAVSADCPDIASPSIGVVTDCTVTLDSGDTYLVHATSDDGLGGFSFEVDDDSIPAGNSTDG